MNFLGIGPGELLLIMIILLVIVGPERLPGLARQVGRWVVIVRNWMQSSPDAAMVLRARQEIEQELTMLKSSLLEVQSIRDEVLGAAKQFNEVVSPLTEGKVTLDDLINPTSGTGQPATSADPTAASPAGEAAAPTYYPPAFDPTPISKSELDQVLAVARNTMVEDTWGAPEQPEAPAIEDSWGAPEQPALPANATEELNLRIQAIMTDLWTLQEHLKHLGILDDSWKPPSTRMQLPDSPPHTHVEEADR
jgi:Sec-independent protein translocase protein TatA